MPLPITVDDQQNLPQGFEDYYKESDSGVFVLDVEGVDNHPDVKGLKNAYQSEKQKRQTLAQQRDQLKKRADLLPEELPDDLDAETLKSLLDKLNADPDNADPGNNNNGKNTPDPAKIREQIEKKWKAENDKLQENLTSKEKQIRDLVVDNNLTAALSKNKVTHPAYQKAAKRLLQDQIKIQENDNGQIVAVVETDMGETSLDQFVRDWAAGEEGAAFVDGNSGSGAFGSNKGPKGKKQMPRSQFDQLGSAEKSAFTRNGGKVYDD